MKTIFFILFGVCTVVSRCTATVPIMPKVLLAQADISKVAQVEAGKLKTANASWWGFNKDDATDCLQNAINSGVPKLIVDNVGSEWIINKPLNLVSNQEIVFADGVVIQAKKDCFHDVSDSLFLGRNLTNVTLQGEGKAILRMRKADYQNASIYTKAEWRSGISLYDCTNVILRGFTVAQTGGDGLYLGATSNGYNKNVLVENMVFDGNHRQGISVISVDGFTVRNSKFINTIGTLPQAGIDFEPNHAGQRLSNVVIEDSIFAGNAGDGVDIYAVHLDDKTPPVSITFNRCTIANNTAGGFASAFVAQSSKTPVTGKVIFNECNFDGNSILLLNPVEKSVSYLFNDCRIDFRNPSENDASKRKSPIVLKTDSAVKDPVIDNITFNNTTVIINKAQTPIRLEFWKDAKISNQINGMLEIKQEGRSSRVELPSYLQENKSQLIVPANEILQELVAKLPQTQTEAQHQQMQIKIRDLEKSGSLQNNLLKNGNFSQVADSKTPGKKDVRLWSIWQASNSDGTFESDSQLNQEDDTGSSAVISGAFSGSLSQNVKVRPGETYVIRGWIRRVGMGVGSLKAGWKDINNKWIDGSKGPTFYAPIQDNSEGHWQIVEGIVTAPENAHIMVFICGVQYQRSAEDKVWFDNVAVFGNYKLDISANIQ